MEDNYTRIPNTLFSQVMPFITGSQLKVLLYICRLTIGFHKTSDQISYSQVVKGTGLSRQAVSDAICELENNEIIKVDRSKHTSRYDISNLLNGQISRLVKKVDQNGQESRLPNGQKSRHTKESNKEKQRYSIEDGVRWDEEQPIDYKSFINKFNSLYDKDIRVTDKKKENIRARLRTFTGVEICEAWQNRLHDEWLTGEGHKYLGNWKAAMRNDEKIDKYLNQDLGKKSKNSQFRADTKHFN